MTPKNEIIKIDGIPVKRCNLCGLIKTLDGYFKCSSVKSGIRGDCKSCCTANRKAKYKYIAKKEKYRKIKQVYGLDKEEYDALFKVQNGCCVICNTHSSKLKRGLHVDHSHKSGKVRGLLCGNCNKGLGSLKDSIELVSKAKDYLIERGE